VSGSAHGTQATFAYQFAYGDYVMTTTISADGARMTGRMSDKGIMMPYPVAWVPLKDGEQWLPGPYDSADEAKDSYDLAMISADAGATEYVPGRAYSLFYIHGAPHGGIGGDLGAFSYLELSQAGADGALQAGPVSFTEPQLAVSLTVQVQNDLFTKIVATTGNGHHFTFTATLAQ
jgi:hypothetical protein